MIIKFLIFLVAVEHLYILWIEMFSWTKQGKRMFKSIPEDLFEKTKVMAGNQGLYNGFLSVGLMWSLIIQNNIWSKNISIYFLSCVIIAGIYGAITSDKKIFLKQGLPALITLLLIFIS